MKGQDTAELFFDDVRVPADHLLGGDEGLGSLQLMEQLARERLIIAVTSVTSVTTAVADTVVYTRTRTAFGSALFEFQNTRFTLAECAPDAAVCRVFVDHCIESYLRNVAGHLDRGDGEMVVQRPSVPSLGRVCAAARRVRIHQ
jgi:acyl-CoA dehydrogenase